MSSTLEPSLSVSLLADYQSLVDQGKLPSRSQLTQYRAAFRQRFGPEVLANLDGEALLLTMHEHGTYDSLVYWLEFKNDEEFPAVFGSISGGSALKFGFYRRKETGAWMTGTPQKQEEITTAQAIDLARRHRDQLLEGVRLLEALPASAPDRDYQKLQVQMDKLAPNVSGTAWGHKYFSLLFPDKLDDYHAENYQRFHLTKLLQRLPQGKGRYLLAGRFVAIANELAMPINHLSGTLNYRNGRPYRYWQVLANAPESGLARAWERYLAEESIGVGWPKLGDLSAIEYSQEAKKRLQMMMQEVYGDKPGEANELFKFVATMDEGDLVLARDGNTVLGIGQIQGPYTFDPSDANAPNRRPVKWLATGRWKLSAQDGKGSIIQELSKQQNQVDIERWLLEPPPQAAKRPAPSVRPGRVPTLNGIPGRIQAILERKKQVILYGPPGTGKTHWARSTALQLSSYAAFSRPFDELAKEEQAQLNGQVRLCTFHPAYGYEDFLEGYRPQTAGDQLSFALRDGIFKALCKTAQQNPRQPHYLIVDEINRGDIPRIFGELLTVLEKDKRSTGVLLPLSGERFVVPENVYIIGTMNTADRSIALLDTALRRRFGFIELMPDSNTLGKSVIDNTLPLGPWLDAINHKIVENIGRDARNLQIGHAYFLSDGRPITSLARFVQVLEEDVIPLLQEYCYEDYSALEKILGAGIVDGGQQQIRQELFSRSRHAELLAQLVAPFPEIQSSPAALASDTDVLGEEDEDGAGSGEEEKPG